MPRAASALGWGLSPGCAELSRAEAALAAPQGCKGPLGRCKLGFFPTPARQRDALCSPLAALPPRQGDRWPCCLQSALENKQAKRSWCIPVILYSRLSVNIARGLGERVTGFWRDGLAWSDLPRRKKVSLDPQVCKQ